MRLNRIASSRVRSSLVKSCPVYASQGYYESNYFYIESRRVVSRSVSSGRGRSSQGNYNENGKGKIMNEIEQLKAEIYQLRSENSMLKQDLLSAWRVLRLMYETLCEKCIKIEKE
jgi:hypothetical protein